MLINPGHTHGMEVTQDITHNTTEAEITTQLDRVIATGADVTITTTVENLIVIMLGETIIGMEHGLGPGSGEVTVSQ